MKHSFTGFLLLTVLLSGCSRPAPANVGATVNGRAITYAELEKQFEAQFGGPAGERSSGDQAQIQKLEVLRTMVDNEIMLQRAERLGLMAADADVDAKYTELKSPYTQEEFAKQLNARKMSMDELKAQLRRDLSVQKLFNKEITSRISISDKDIAEFYNTNRASFNIAEPQIHMAQILVTPAPDPNVRNLKNDKAQDEEQARKKIQSIDARLRRGEEFGMLAQNYSEDAASSQNGGDLGFIPESSLEKANVELRRIVLSLRPGETSAPIRTAEGYRVLKVITREPAGQRELSDPKVQQTIRETLINRKDQLLKAAYYEMARNDAKVINYFVNGIVGEGQKK
ncbi:MAG: peptidylprolyl isomerase [Bryobacterales bacterium]|nr:peptidylprolyl isomerase [Bryobacterales bacterium]